MTANLHPREVLLGSQAAALSLPVVDHYSGVEVRMRKSLALQAELIEEFGACVMDVSLDCEDGAPVGGEIEHANLVISLVESAGAAIKNIARRIAVRVHPVDHASFESDVKLLVPRIGDKLSHLMIPKVESVNDVELAIKAIDAAGGKHLPIQVLLESSHAVKNAFEIAAHPRVQSLSFGLMDFVSSHGGAIPAFAMTSVGQFNHPLVIRAKLEIAAACHAHGKVPSHCVVTDFSDVSAMENAARRANNELGYTRMWSIHPAQVRPILKALAPDEEEIVDACNIIDLAVKADWAPASYKGHLHDRASYRYYWQLIERAHQTGRALPESIKAYF